MFSDSVGSPNMQQEAIAADLGLYMSNLGDEARAAARVMAQADTATKDRALNAIADELEANRASLLRANRQDVDTGKKNGLDAPLLDRLQLSDERLSAMAQGLREIATLIDPVAEIFDLRYRPSGIQVGRMRVPLGVIGIIYESRPNVTADAAGLCIKSGNAAILRGGSEALRSNQAIVTCIQHGLKLAGLPETAVQVVATAERAAVGALLTMSGTVDLIIPRGGKGLIERVSREARIPVLKHLDGVCHVYIDDRADIDKGVVIALNAKTQRYATCNTMECLLLAESIAAATLEKLAPQLQEKGVEIRGCPRACELLPGIKTATEQDYATEYLAPVMSLKIVSGLVQAMEHIRRYGSQHTDAIVTEDFSRARRFLREVDSSSVMVNASTRFADGFEYGLGAEIGISTDKLHARGPVGLEGLTSVKFVVLGDGQIRR